jgi:hypothetical protein
MQAAIDGPSPRYAIILLAHAFKAEGMAQREMYELFDLYRAKHQDDADETISDAILDTMDGIVGYCSPQCRLFETDLRDSDQPVNPSAPNPDAKSE